MGTVAAPKSRGDSVCESLLPDDLGNVGWPVAWQAEQSHQNAYLIPNCSMRGVPPLVVIRPNCD